MQKHLPHSGKYFLIHDTLIRKDHISIVSWQADTLSLSLEMLNGAQHEFCFDKDDQLNQQIGAFINENLSRN